MEQSTTCPKCRPIKATNLFSKNKNSQPDGLSRYCKSCQADYARAYYQRNGDKVRQSVSQWKRENKEIVNIGVKRYRDMHPDRVKARHRLYDQLNPDKVRNKVNRRRTRRQTNGVFAILPKELTKLYSGPCAYCGSKKYIEADHVIPISRGGRHAIGNLIPACRPCNRSKHDKTIMEWKLKKTATIKYLLERGK